MRIDAVYSLQSVCAFYLPFYYSISNGDRNRSAQFKFYDIMQSFK
jgi:hypothetical protein